jgi:biopolymer transport protein ExbD
MRKLGLPEVHSTHPNVTPLIDVVMCLIVFFMLVAKIGVSTGAERSIDIPVSSLGTELKDLGNTLTLNVREGLEREPFITALVNGSSAQPQELKIVDSAGNKQLYHVLRKLRYGQDERSGGVGANVDNDEFKVIIRGDKNVTYEIVEPVLLTCMQANVKNVNFQAAKPG